MAEVLLMTLAAAIVTARQCARQTAAAEPMATVARCVRPTRSITRAAPDNTVPHGVSRFGAAPPPSPRTSLGATAIRTTVVATASMTVADTSVASRSPAPELMGRRHVGPRRVPG